MCRWPRAASTGSSDMRGRACRCSWWPVLAPGNLPTKLGTLPIRIGAIEFSMRCLFLDQRVAPYILGCADVLDRFVLTIDAGQRKIVFTEIS